jgi:Tol biopolymer transport system component
MELVEGPTLAERIARGAIPLDDALGFARQIAEGLSAAHDKGIVHRDLKPANIKIAPDGTIKLLDFGLAKSDGPWTSSSVDDAPTLTVAMTGAGVIVGTAAYMSPEQARGKQVDKRADIWAFGAIVYEMLTASRLFAGETITDVLASVVQRDPDLSGVPANVQRLLRRCLEKDPKNRVRDANDALLLLDSSGDPVVAQSPSQRGYLMTALVVAAALLVALAWVAFTHFRETPPAAQVLRFQIGLPDRVQFTQSGVVTISPDGRKVAFSAYGGDGEPRVWVRALDSPTATSLAGAEIGQVTNPFFWSHDSRFIAFEQGGRLKRIPAEGGTVQVIAEPIKPVRGQWVIGGSWNRDNVVIVGTTDGIMRVPADGGTPTPVTTLGEGEFAHRFPAFLPDGRRFLYLRGGGGGNRYIAVGDLNAAASAQSTTPIVKTDFAAVAVPTELGGPLKLLYQRDETVFVQDFDSQALSLTGEPVAIVDRVANFVPGGIPYFSASNTGALVYRTIAGDNRQLTWFNREGEVTGTPGETGLYGSVQLAPDGTRAAVVPNVALAQQPPNHDVWIVDLNQGASRRLTFDPASDSQPVWSPDGKSIAWNWRGIKESAFMRKAADGSGLEERLDTYQDLRQLTDWTHNGYLIFHLSTGDIWALPVDADAAGKRTPIAVVTSPAFEVGARVSPDNRWIAYISNQTGRQEMFVQPFALGGRAATGKWQVSTRGTMGLPEWRSDSRELTFLSGDGAVVAVDVAPGPTFQAGAQRTLFELPRELFAIVTQSVLIDATRDNQRFLMIMPVQESSQREIGVFVNWASAQNRDATSR